MNKVLIFGHKKPDTDSVVAAISLSYLKNKLGMSCEPIVLGEINSETKFILDYFNIKHPKYLNDVKLEVKDVNYLKNNFVSEYESVYKCFNYMTDKKISTLPIIDDNGKYCGAVSMKDIAKDSVNGDWEILNTSYKNIIDTLNGKEIAKYDEEITGNILIASYRSTTFIENVDLTPDTILIVGDRHSIIEYAIEKNVKMIILTGGSQIKEEHLKIAKEKHINIISTNYNTFNVARKIGLCNYITKIDIDKNVTYVNETTDLNDFIDLANRTKYSNFPVINKDGKCLGIIRLADTAERNKKQVILVDHNEAEQSVDGLHDANIVEIIDHHKIGTLGTTMPINFRNMPVGSTNTIIYNLFKENNVEIPSDIAGIMMSAIISDTLLFKSPTTTEIDKDIVRRLSEIAQLDYKKFAMDMFKAGSMIKNKSPEEILYADFKNFNIDGARIGIGQLSTVSPDDVINRKQDYIDLLNRIGKENDYKLIALFVTDIINNCSYCFFNDKGKLVLENSFDKDFYQGIKMDGILSRKKQIIPAIMNTLEKK